MTEVPSPPVLPGLAGVVLAGGAARRLGGIDKPSLRVEGVPLLVTATTALRAAEPVIVVGPRRPLPADVRWVREEPPGSGPVAALAAALALLDRLAPPSDDMTDASDTTETTDTTGTSDATGMTVAVLAADLPGVTAHTVARLWSALRGDPAADGALLVDETGHRQWLTGIWRRAALTTAVPTEPRGASMRGTLGMSSIVEVAALADEARDIDTPEDLRP
ncbi:molybdenum cofactor guanylyltransferase [Saccharomonospora piscinae]|uniref:molybdenum cofactor guanylyltransferase n=1 Tax=Saccharomonospora piscinae TaxID=687388 RepID=UPI0011066193|nr:NTP transferase domain-containing protein [Saccharomonospora piscinae]TLW94952.1 molybdenum cofactor guanylyltransferase [Saccharomonospora piscinae]